MTTTLILLGLAALLTIAIYVANKAEKVEPLPYEDAYNEAYDNYDELDLMQNPEPVNYGYTQPVIKLKKKTEKKLKKEASKPKNVPAKKKKKKN